MEWGLHRFVVEADFHCLDKAAEEEDQLADEEDEVAAEEDKMTDERLGFRDGFDFRGLGKKMR